MPFLYTRSNNSLGITLSVVIIYFTLAIKLGNGDLIYIIPLSFILISFLLLYIWWHERLKATYLKRMTMRELDFLNNEIATLKQDNEKLSALIHKDNKLIPAMLMALQEYLRQSDTAAGQALLDQLKDLSINRQHVLDSCVSINTLLPSSGMTGVDALMNYMYQKALKNHISLSLNILPGKNQKPFYTNILAILSETELCTLIADMLDNAIIASNYGENLSLSRHSNSEIEPTPETTLPNEFSGNKVSSKLISDKKILVELSCDLSGICSITVSDSGVHFTKDVLVNLGRKRITTHKDRGTGIGLPTIYRIICEHNATLIIDETISDPVYSKKISVIFDGRRQYILLTHAREKERNYLARRTDLMINPE